MVSLFFIISYIFLMYSFLRVKKTDKKINILLWIFLFVVLYMGYNAIIVYLLSVLNIKATLLLRSIINLVMALGLFFLVKKKQKYYFDKTDLGIVILLFYATFVIFLVRFGFGFNIEFEMDDAAVHFAYGKAFMNSDILGSEMTNIAYSLANRHLFFASVNLGTLMRVLLPITGLFGIYKSFIIFELFSFFLSGVLLYFIICREKETNKKYLLTISLLFLYMLGYPLTNLLCGFHYWGLAVIVIEGIILLIKEIDNNKLYDNYLIIGMLFILTVSLFITYYLYVPLIYLSIFMCYLYLWRRKLISIKQLIIYTVVTLIIPFIFGICYFGILGEYFTNTGSTNLEIDGPNYKNLIGNFIFLLPLFIYKLVNEIKERKISFVNILAILNIVYMIVLFILVMTDKMSNYYFAKIYNLTWLIFYIYFFKIIYDDWKDIVKVYMLSYIALSLLALFRIEKIITDYDSKISEDNAIMNLGNVYDYNMKYLIRKDKTMSNEIYDLLKHVYKDRKKYQNPRGEIPFIASYFRKIWIVQIIDTIPNSHDNAGSKKGFVVNKYWINNDIIDIENNEDTQYFVWIVDKSNNDALDLANYDIMYQNKAGYILKKKS